MVCLPKAPPNKPEEVLYSNFISIATNRAAIFSCSRGRALFLQQDEYWVSKIKSWSRSKCSHTTYYHSLEMNSQGSATTQHTRIGVFVQPKRNPKEKPSTPICMPCPYSRQTTTTSTLFICVNAELYHFIQYCRLQR